MTQKTFDTDNEKDMDLLWSLFPKDVKEITPQTRIWISNDDTTFFHYKTLSIEWHGKSKITRPEEKVTEEDIGKLCKFWDEGDSNVVYGELTGIRIDSFDQPEYEVGSYSEFDHCSLLTKVDVIELENRFRKERDNDQTA